MFGKREIQFSPVESGVSRKHLKEPSPRTDKEPSAFKETGISPADETAPLIHDVTDLSPARERAFEIAGATGISPRKEKEALPPMPDALEDFPLPRLVFQQAMETMRQELQESESVRARDLLATFESYHAHDLDREEALHEIDRLTEKLKTTRERHGDKRMLQELTRTVYDRGYQLSQNTMLGLFTGPEKGNCQATAKATSMILEEVGLDPKTEIAHQMFSNHVRTVAKIDGAWYVLEGKARRLKDKELDGTVLVSLEDEKRGLLDLLPEHPIEMGTKPFHEADGSVLNRGLFDWFKQSLTQIDTWIGGQFPHKTPSIHKHIGTKSFGLDEITNLTSLLGSLIPFTPKTRKIIASSLAALSFLYATNRLRDPEVHSMAELTEVIDTDIKTAQEQIDQALDALTEFARQNLKELESSVNLEARLPKNVSNETPNKIEGVSRSQWNELEHRMNAYYGMAHYVFGEGGTFTETLNGWRVDIHVQPEAKTIGKDLYREWLRGAYGIMKDGIPDHLVIDFHGEQLDPRQERENLQEIKEHLSEFHVNNNPEKPFPIDLEFRVNGKGISDTEQTSTPEAESEHAEMEQELKDAVEWGHMKWLEQSDGMMTNILNDIRIPHIKWLEDEYTRLKLNHEALWKTGKTRGYSPQTMLNTLKKDFQNLQKWSSRSTAYALYDMDPKNVPPQFLRLQGILGDVVDCTSIIEGDDLFVEDVHKLWDLTHRLEKEFIKFTKEEIDQSPVMVDPLVENIEQDLESIKRVLINRFTSQQHQSHFTLEQKIRLRLILDIPINALDTPASSEELYRSSIKWRKMNETERPEPTSEELEEILRRLKQGRSNP